MKISKLLVAIMVSVVLPWGLAEAREKKQEQGSVKSSDVPAAVQKAAKKQATGANIVRWQKVNGNYEAVIEKNGKQIGYTFEPNGKLLHAVEKPTTYSR